jgi:hypothetical protein
VFEAGPDDGPDSRVYFGFNEGLVLFRNELTRVFLPGQSLGRKDASGNPIVATKPHYEETFSAALANTVDNFRSLEPLVPRTFKYEIRMPTKEELAELGIDSIKAPLHVHAQINYEHFPPLFIRFLENGDARATSGISERILACSSGSERLQLRRKPPICHYCAGFALNNGERLSEPKWLAPRHGFEPRFTAGRFGWKRMPPPRGEGGGLEGLFGSEAVSALAIVTWFGINAQAHLLFECAAEEATHRMGLPAGGLA